MADYEPLDLGALCNAGREIYGPDHSPATGEQSYQGLPFHIGDAEKACFIAFGPRPPLCSEPMSIPIRRAARRLIFAHALLESRLKEGDLPGRVVARYAMIYADGERIEAPVRERFEIATVDNGWGELPFIASPDRKDRLAERYRGSWDAVGFRQTEVGLGTARDYCLWAWKNPRPEKAIERVEILPGGGKEDESVRRFLIAAITIGYSNEEPFARSAALPVKLTLARPEDRAAPFSLAVEVDRGTATYPFALPEQPADQFITDPQKGWGEAQNHDNSPAYVEISATPSATVRVRRDDEELGQARWGELEEQRVVDTGRVLFEVVDTGRNWVHTTVLDEDTGRPIPCRIHFRTPDGIPYAPHGHHAHVNSNMGTWHIDVGGDVRLGQITYAYIDGKCQGWLPRGEIIVDAARGYEYEPLREKVTIQPGQRELTLRLKRRQHLNAERYFSGDTHVHFLSTQGALLEAAAEDVDVVNLMQSQWGHLFTSTEEFTGRPAVAYDGETIIWASQENRQHLLGHLSLLGLKEPVMPWCSDGPDEAEMGGNMETTLSHWADACHTQGGTVVIPHMPNPNGEPAALIATGRADAVEMLIHNPFFHLEYYRYLNAGYRLPLAGGTDKMDSGVPVGLYRTYAHIPADEPFTYENWCKALRSGNTFLSGGPLLRFSVEGQPIGSTVMLGADGGTVEVEAAASSIFPVHRLEVVHNGEVVACEEQLAGARELRLKTRLKVEGAGWLCVRCAGPGYTAQQHHDTWGRGIMAHTSPVYLACGGDYDLYNAETMQYMLTLIDGSLQHIRHGARQWKPGTVTHHHGETDHQAYLERPFQEALAAIHRRMHQHGIPH